MSILVFSSFIFFFDRATDRTAEPIFMAGSSNDEFSRKKVPSWGEVDT
jgi:hypothetical protein